MDHEDTVTIWRRAGNQTPPRQLSLYAQALVRECPVGTYRALNDAQEDQALLALFRVDRPQATLASLHQLPALALSSYHQLLHDLAREGLGPGGFDGEVPTCPSLTARSNPPDHPWRSHV
ncbi:hypothetical protein ACIQTZ_21480 [Paenarthrobacter sp. NPDC090520]|uniref:hypothetical protein n=1 Tax=Paenarthrobacter sp. NPDC090520 TaxID=3364382 RepID=UPI0037FFDF9B